MRKIIAVLSFMIFVACFYTASAEAMKANEVRQKLSAQFTNFKITDVKESEIAGLYEVTAGGNIMYSDGNYLMMGHMFDFTGKDLTQEKINGLTAKAAAELDKNLAIKIGTGKKEVVEFTDPECPYCLKAEGFFEDADVTRYVYFFPLSFHKNAERLALDILCSDNPEAEYHAVIKAVSSGQADSYKTQACESGRERLKKMVDATQKLSIRGTPFFFIDGKAISGADPAIQQMIK